VARFDRYMLSQLLVLFGFFSLVLVSVYWVNRAIGLFDQLISDGQTAAGASTARIGRPVFVFGVLVALLVAILAHVLVPAARTDLAGRSQEISRDITAQFLKAGQDEQ